MNAKTKLSRGGGAVLNRTLKYISAEVSYA